MRLMRRSSVSTRRRRLLGDHGWENAPAAPPNRHGRRRPGPSFASAFLYEPRDVHALVGRPTRSPCILPRRRNPNSPPSTCVSPSPSPRGATTLAAETDDGHRLGRLGRGEGRTKGRDSGFDWKRESLGIGGEVRFRKEPPAREGRVESGMDKRQRAMLVLLVLLVLFSALTMGAGGVESIVIYARKLGNVVVTCEEAKEARERSRIPYLVLHRCWLRNHPVAGYAALVFFMVVWFYILGNVASECFCASLEGISDIFRIPPTLSGVTLLPFGNGAPDLFSSLASFAYEPSVGLNSVLGGGLFVTTLVVGVVSIVGVGERSVQKHCFVRDVLFYLLAVLSMMAMYLVPSATVWHASYMLFLYVLYGISVWWIEKKVQVHQFGEENPTTPLLQGNEEREIEMGEVDQAHHEGLSRLPQWEASRLAQHSVFAHDKPKPRPLWDHSGAERVCTPVCATCLWYLGEAIHFPQKLTIPPVSETSWSKTFASVSIVGAALSLTWIWGNPTSDLLGFPLWIFVLGISTVGSMLSLVFSTKAPPQQDWVRLFWILLAFIMSVAWIDLAAGELVSAMVALARLLAVSPGILGGTLLAWGNSIGDLISNSTIAKSPSTGGIQMAISGCYAGPLFNLLVGIGLSLFLTCLRQYPQHMVLPIDSRLLWIGVFISVGLITSLAITLNDKFRISKQLGFVLLVIYGIFMIRQFVSTSQV